MVNFMTCKLYLDKAVIQKKVTEADEGRRAVRSGKGPF